MRAYKWGSGYEIWKSSVLGLSKETKPVRLVHTVLEAQKCHNLPSAG